MYQFFMEEEININNTYYFNKDDSHHIKNVLRLNKGEIIRVVYGSKGYFGKIDYDNGKPVVNIETLDNVKHELDIKITLIQSLIKVDKFELLLQKSCELGVSKIVPLYTSRCNIKKDIYDKKRNRFNKIILESCKQCKREVLPIVEDTINLDVINKYKSDINLFAYELDDNNSLINFIEKGKHITVVIGPEGGFTHQEALFLRDNGFIPISLGKRILRAETAGIYTISVIGAINEG